MSGIPGHERWPGVFNQKRGDNRKKRRKMAMDDFNKIFPYVFYFKATLLSKFYRLFGKTAGTNYTAQTSKLEDLRDPYVDMNHSTNRFSKLTNIVCFCESNILLSLWGDKKSGYKVEYPRLHKFLQHCSMHSGDSWCDKQYYYDFFRPVKRIFNKITNREMKVEPVEVATICSEIDNLKIIIRIHSDDCGYMSDELIPENQSPAYAHIFSKYGEKLSVLNITGPMPQKAKNVIIKQVRQYGERSQKIKNEIAKWARRPSKLPSCRNMTGWEAAKFTWRMYHPDNRNTGSVNGDWTKEITYD
jgi:hypothetical protein